MTHLDKQISNAALDKISPQKELTQEQQQLVNRIKSFCIDHIRDSRHSVFTIYGDAGTGKSVILSHLFDELQLTSKTDNNSILYDTNNYFLVNHPEVLKVYKQIADQSPYLYKKNYQRPTSFINQLDKQQRSADITIIDEAHLLLSKPDHYNNFYYTNQLTEIIKRSKVVILVFDEHQVLRMKGFWTKARLNQLLQSYHHESYQLRHQFRMTASDELIQWFNDFTAGNLHSLPANACHNYDFRIFSDAEQMRKTIVKRNQEVQLSRMVSTSGYPSTLDGGLHYINEGQFKMPWDQYNYTATPWAEIPNTINEVGSIYTCQGFDLNYAGIIIGPPFILNPATNQLQINLDKYTDVEAFKRRKDITDPQEITTIEKTMVMNSLNVLFKRGIFGTYLYAHDNNLRGRLIELFAQIKK
ncbi:hypothetical protein LOOC260_111040 [Paucilactobacillus hokkaidonensis JCM 18461]|uniref:Schlafen group 3-like DNA/RNA helicase domain-containing protein n=2 Tax=Paucilactobacillus hokkaidonensis TaxID=1193095 RepID=A0A0A1GXK9_9LACO|nr:DUF2075 domain-containing protein [Paucilactobacillus hokkaidonensis]KRO10651.1 hypothetical protein IV59_GL001342 [Paucilactobacillus hokkaidonensis]BAP85643.1 hypothetical protein LOOC260_111040 [Paucilactobacillus hokkaidonensis JCM 18461]